MKKLRKLWVSISGGRTSAYMAIKLKENYSDRYDLKYVYANTGLEDEETLIFLDGIDKIFNLGIVWVESVAHKEKGRGSTHTVVDFDSACRDGRLFEEMIDVYGIPNMAYPHCTRELKINPMKSYMKSIEWGGEFRAIGIRDDERGRVPEKAASERKLYPLVDFFPTTKEDVLDFFNGYSFDLNLPEHKGNCVTCWKKSDTKILRLIDEDPDAFDFFDRMEKEKGLCGHNVDGTHRKFFRKNRSVNDMRMLEGVVGGGDSYSKLARCATEECGME
tara:strand:- start:763 stop:1587 length:825 start_codon:yes stop_codon:yes gene_type:complete